MLQCPKHGNVSIQDLTIKVGSTLFVNGYTKCWVKIGQITESVCFTGVSSTSVTVGINEMPSGSSNLRRFGLTESDLGCPDAESLGRFPDSGSSAVRVRWVGVERYDTRFCTLAHHTSSRRLGISPAVVGVWADSRPHETWNGTLAAYIPSRHQGVLQRDVGHFSHQTALLSPGFLQSVASVSVGLRLC